MGIRVWVPRRPLPLDVDPEPAHARESRGGEVASEGAVSKDDRREVEVPRIAKIAEQPSPSSEKEAPPYSLRSLSLRSRGCNVLIEDDIYADRSFCRDLLAACHSFEQSNDIRETRFDWPLASLQDASEEAAKRALSAFLAQDSFVCVRGDGIANLLFGPGCWKSFPETMEFDGVRAWVLGSDVNLEDAETRRRLWQSILRMDFG